MVLTAANVKVAVTGSVYVAVSGTALPTTVTGALNAAFTDVGYISEDGITAATASDQTDIKAWQNGDTVRSIQSGHDFTVAFTMIETNEKTLEVYFNNFTHGAGAASGIAQVKGTAPYRGAWVINVVDGTDLIRIVIPDGQISARDDISLASGDAIGYGVTIKAYPDASGVKAYYYTETVAAS